MQTRTPQRPGLRWLPLLAIAVAGILMALDNLYQCYPLRDPVEGGRLLAGLASLLVWLTAQPTYKG
ncbi:MAG: hypothetical protein ACPG1A_14255 [Halioglobus sp.]